MAERTGGWLAWFSSAAISFPGPVAALPVARRPLVRRPEGTAEVTMRVGVRRWRPAVIGLAVLASLMVGCSTTAPPAPSSSPVASAAETPHPPTGVDYAALQQNLQSRLAAAPDTQKAVRSIVLTVDGATKISIYRDRKPTDHAHVWSVTKSVLSILVGIAVEEGRLRLDQSLAELLPEHVAVMTSQQQTITLEQLLTMTAGMPGDDGGLSLESDDPTGQLLAYGLSNDPGATFLYSNSSAQLVATVLHRAIDRPILDYAREKLFDPLGIVTRPAWEESDEKQGGGFDQAGFAWMRDSAGTHTGAFGLRLTTPDLTRLGQLYLDDGQWNGQQLVPADWVARSTSPQLTPEQAVEGQYGYLWWIIDDPGTGVRGYGAAGSWYQRIMVIPSRRVVLVVTAEDVDVPEDGVGPVLEPLLFDEVLAPLAR